MTSNTCFLVGGSVDLAAKAFAEDILASSLVVPNGDYIQLCL